MIVDSIRVEENELNFGKITTLARLIDSQQNTLARVSQSVSLWQGSRVIELEISIIEFAADLQPDPWNSYLACRFAWSDESPMAANFHFLLFGQGNVPWMVHELLRKAEHDPARRPRVIIG